MFTKKSNIDLKKSTAKIQDSKKDSTARLRHLKTILEHVDSEEAKNLFEANYSHVYYILYDTFVQAEANLRQRVHKTHREELDGSLWLLSKILCLLPELIARRWQVHSLGRILAKLLHYGNSVKLRREGVRYFLLWYQALGDNAPPFVHGMFTELVPGLTIPQKGKNGPLSSDSEFIATDVLNHPNMKGELGGSVFHDTGAHPVKSPEIQPLIPPGSSERTAAPDPRDGLEILLDCMVQSCGCLKWRDNSPQKHIRSFNFLLTKFREQYLPVFCPNFDYTTSIYEPKLDLPAMRNISKREEVMSSCIVVLVIWIAKYTHERQNSNKLDNVQVEEESVGESASLLSNLRHLGYTQTQLVRDVLYSSRDMINFVHEIYRQAFLMSFTSKSQIEAMRIAISVYRDWMSTIPPPPFLLEPDSSEVELQQQLNQQPQQIAGRPQNQRLRTDSYLGAMSKENVMIRAGLQNVLQVFVTNAVNVFMVNTAHLNIHFQSKTNNVGFATPLDEQTDICKRVLNIYRTMVMKTRMEGRTWEQLLLVLLQITSVILQNSPPNAKKNNLGGRLAQPIFQTLIVTWIRAHTNVVVHPGLWDKFLKVLSSLNHREELIVEWDKTMQTLTRVLARQVYNINLSDLPLDRLAEQKGKRKRGTPSNWAQSSSLGGQGGLDKADSLGSGAPCNSTNEKVSIEDHGCGYDVRNSSGSGGHALRSVPGTPALNRSYSEGSLAPFRKSRGRRRVRNKQHVSALPMNVEHSLNRMLSNTSGGGLSISTENFDVSRFSQCDDSIMMSVQLPAVPTLRRALSLDSIRPPTGKNQRTGDSDSYRCGSRSPSPTASSGIESGSIKDSPMQIDVMTADSSSIDTQDENSSISADRRSILSGGTARGWLPDVASVMWRRMLGALGDVNKILNPKLHAQVFQYLVNMTESLIKIRMNQGISLDGQPIQNPMNLVPPIALVAPWCYGALTLDNQYTQGKLYAMQLLCTIVKSGASLGNNQLPLFYHALHQALSGEDRAMAYTALRFLGGPRFISLLLPGHTLLLLDLVHASTIVLTSSETGPHAPRAEVAGLLGSLLCFPRTSLPGPVLTPSEPNIDLMECPDLQEHVLNIVLRCARREPTAKARCIAIASLGQWILQNLINPINSPGAGSESSFKQRIPQHHSSMGSTKGELPSNPRIREAFQVLLQALQFKHRTIARLASETLKLCAEQGHRIERIDRLPQLIIDTICLSLEIQNVPHPKESDKVVLTSLLLTLGEFCMSLSVETLLRPKSSDTDEPLIQVVFKVLYKIAMGIHNGERIKLFTTDEDFDMSISVDDVQEQSSPAEPTYQTPESIASCQSAIRLCAKTVAMHLITNLGHFPMGIGATRLSSLVDEHDDLTGSSGGMGTLQRESSVMSNRDSMDLGATQVLASPNLQLLMLSSELVASFIELPALKLPGGGVTAGLMTAHRQVRLLLRDLNGKACWDASILYKEPIINGEDSIRQTKENSPSNDKLTFQLRTGAGSNRMFGGAAPSIDPMMSTVGLPIAPLRHTLRHRPVHQLPVAKDLAPDLDQLDDLLQYIGYTSPECLDGADSPLNTAGPSPLGPALEGQTISIILNQRAIEMEYIARQNTAVGLLGESPAYTFGGSVGYTSFIDDSAPPVMGGSGGTLAARLNASTSSIDRSSTNTGEPNTKPFQFGRILFSQLGLAGWERRKRTHLLQRTDKLLRELRNLDNQKCRETHKMAVIYVANGQEDKNSILRNSCGSSTYELFVSALGWEVELESHNGFLGGLPRQGCGQTAPYYATPFLEVIYHVSTRMPSDTPEAILNKTRHLGNDEVHIVWSEHNRDYRRDILPTEFCDVLIVIYPLKSGLFRVTVNKKADVPWFGPLSDEMVVGGSCLASLVRASAINASRSKRTSLSLYQQYYEERNRSLDTVSTRHKESNTFEDFTARIFSPIPPQGTVSAGHSGSNASGSGAPGGPVVAPPLAAALIDQHSRTVSKTWIHHPETVATAREVTHQTVMASVSLEQPSPRAHRKLAHPFKQTSSSGTSSKSHKSPPTTGQPMAMGASGGMGGGSLLSHQLSHGTAYHHHLPTASGTPPDSPTFPGRSKFK
ncbi:probable Rho GTPase-activating protein CG5521 isoform X2 [Uranotaenia lowii]|uniref:probable Rho GTPase-activating protein CG5521 isoform X2 n=1 Tax=Uranotaenia lowii TaxID=190385 RepID=UPI00247AF22F|nr:probable Rho GTPase-activating protein CG5521 isoform X2 [Uranotaenia lowii]